MKTFLGLLATFIAIYSYIPYFRNILSGKTKPHAFSWFIWSLLTGIGFFAALSDNGGPGTWVSGVTAIVCLAISALALRNGTKDIVTFDWFCLGGALVALLLWAMTSTPLFSVVLITIIDAIGFLPTFRKAYKKPNEETVLTYFLSAVKYVIAIIALDNMTVITALFPLSLVLTNGLFVTMTLTRRKQLARN